MPGELGFFKPPPTVFDGIVEKVESPLRAGIFLDYYMFPDGKFSGQYVCVPLEDFSGKNLHRRMDRKHFHLHLHRTEVVKRPATAKNPVMPLKYKYYYSNYNVEGIEKKDSDIECIPLSDYSADMPSEDPADKDLDTVEVVLGPDYYDFDDHHRVASDGRVISIDPGTG